MEAVLLLATAAQRFLPLVPTGAVITPLPTMTLRSGQGLPAVLEERRRVRG
jgi:hypothetical protein